MSDEQRIAQYLVEKYNPLAIVLHGSRARGLNRANSDWDLYVFVDREGVVGVSELWNEFSLDVDIVKLPITAADFRNTFLGTLRVTRILYQRTPNDPELTALFTLAERTYAQSAPLSPERYERRKQYLHRLLLRLDGYLDQPELFFFYLACFYEELFVYWYEVRSEWSEPLYLAWPDIQGRDPEYAELMRKLIGPASPQNKLAAARALKQRLFPG